MALIWNVDMGFNRKHFRRCTSARADDCRSTSPFWISGPINPTDAAQGFVEGWAFEEFMHPCCERHLTFALKKWVEPEEPGLWEPWP